MGKKIILVLVMICLSFSLFALDLPNAEEYKEGELPKWSLKIRRSEIIFFGSLPITYPITSLILNKTFKNEPQIWQKVVIAASASAAITLADYIIGLTK